jgi:LacI family transcriptional regulator
MARATLKQIANVAGVSVSTVSLALSGKGKISKPQVDRIRKLAADLGYTPSPLLASLASKRFRSGDSSLGNLIAILAFPYASSSNPNANLYQAPLIDYARSLGYNPQFFDAKSMQAYNDLPGTLYRRGTLGVIVTGQPDPKLFDDAERWSQFSIVQCGRFLSPIPVNTVRPDIFSAINLAYKKLRELGYQRIGFACGTHVPLLADDLARHGTAYAIQTFGGNDCSYIPAYRGMINDPAAFAAWIDECKPDCVVGFSIGHYYYLTDRGLRVPQDIGFACLHLHMKDGKLIESQFSGLYQRTSELARQSVIQLDQMIRHNERGFPEIPVQTLISSTWHEGSTLSRNLAVGG